MKRTFPDSTYFELPISIWSHSLNSNEPWNLTLGEFLSGEVFINRRVRIRIKDFQWFFKINSKSGGKPIIDPKLYLKIEKLLDGKSIPEAVTAIRAYVKIHGKDEVIEGAKKIMPGATISAQFDRKRKAIEPHKKNNMIALDIDGVEVDGMIEKLRLLNICFWISRSITGTGVYALVPLATENLIGHFEAINLLMQENGIQLDPLKDVTRLRYWSPPDDAIINLEVQPFSDVYIIPEEIKRNRWSKEAPIHSLPQTTKFDSHDYALACHKKGLKNAARNLTLEEGEVGQHLHNFIKYYHWAFNHYGISADYSIQWSWDNFFHNSTYIIEKAHTINKIESTFRNFYNCYKEQHHTLDFEAQKQKSLGSEKYDLELTLPNGRKLSSLALPVLTKNVKENQFNATEWAGWEKYILDSPTNSGKTSTFRRYFFDQKVKGLIVVPTQGALEQLKEDAKKEKQEVTLFYEKNKTVTESDLLICTTYASFKKLSKVISVKDRFLVIDEFHNVVLSASKEFRNYELNNILDRLLEFKHVVLMTGTNIKCHHPVLSVFKRVKVKYQIDTEKNLQIVYYSTKNRWSSVMQRVKSYDELQVIYMDDKQETKGLGKLIQSLEQMGFKRNEIQLANSDQKLEVEYRDMILTGEVRPEVKIIIATKIFVEALNLYNNVAAFHILTSIHGAYMQQLVTRPRRNKMCDVFLYWHLNNLTDQDATFWFDQEYFYSRLIRLANKFSAVFGDEDWDDILRKNFNGNDVVRRRSVERFSTDGGLGIEDIQQDGYKVVLEIDYLNCDYNTQEAQVQLYRKNPHQLYEYLKQYNWTIKESATSQSLDDQINDEVIKMRKQTFESDVASFIADMTSKGVLENEDILDEKSYGNIGWQIELRKRYANLGNLLKESDANELMIRLQNNKKGYQVLLKQIKVRQALLFGRDDTRDFAGILFDLFPIESKWSSVEILNKLQNVQQSVLRAIHDMQRLSSTTAATQLLNQFIETKRCKIIDPNGVPLKGRNIAYMNGYEVISHHPIRKDNGEAIEPLVSKGDFGRRPRHIRNSYRIPKWQADLANSK